MRHKDALQRPLVRDEILEYPLPELSAQESSIRYERTTAVNTAILDLKVTNTVEYLLEPSGWIPPMRDGVGPYLEFDLVVTVPAGQNPNPPLKNIFVDIPGLIQDCFIRIGASQILPNTLNSFPSYWSSWLSRCERSYLNAKGQQFGLTTQQDTGVQIHPFYNPILINGAGTGATYTANNTYHVCVPLPPLSVIGNTVGGAFPLKLIDERVYVKFNLNAASAFVVNTDVNAITTPALGIPAGYGLSIQNYWLKLPIMDVDPRAEDPILERYQKSATDKSMALAFDFPAVSYFSQTLPDTLTTASFVWNIGESIQFAEHLEVALHPGATRGLNFYPASGSCRAGITEWRTTMDGHPLTQWPVRATDPNNSNLIRAALTCDESYQHYITMATALNKRDGIDAAPIITQQQTTGSSGVYDLATGATNLPLVKPYFVCAQPLGCAYGEEKLDGSIVIKQGVNLYLTRAAAGGGDVNTTGTDYTVVMMIHHRSRVFVAKGDVAVKN